VGAFALIELVPRILEEGEVSAAKVETVLVVDRDATSRRFVELTLGRAGFAVETAQDAGAAQETLKSELVDLIVCGTELDDMDGLTFYHRLSAQHRLRSIPFIFLSADKSVSSKVNALRAGADDYIVKPCDVGEFVARAESLISKQRRLREVTRSRSFSLAGEVSVIPFVDIIALLEMTRRSGVLSLVTPAVSGQLHFENGYIVHAHCGNLVGLPAFFRLFAEEAGRFEFSLDAGNPEARTIEGSATALVLEAARLRDTSRRDQTARPAERKEPAAELIERPAVKPASRPDPLGSTRWELMLRDKFALGELSLWSRESLSEWTRSEVAQDRLHVHVVADLPAGVSSMVPLGGQPSEQWVLESLRETRKAFGLTFFLRRERIVDVVLIDAADPTALLPCFGRTPEVMLICPPDGSLLSLGSAALAGLEHLIRALAPPAILGVGGEALAAGLSALEAIRERAIPVKCVTGSLGDGRRDLRELLVEAVHLWKSKG
jgi:CheY-like chemotaxis protein